MTEAEWLGSVDPLLMLNFLRGRANPRKARLAGVAAIRHVWEAARDARRGLWTQLPEIEPDDAQRLDTAEQLADGHVEREDALLSLPKSDLSHWWGECDSHCLEFFLAARYMLGHLIVTGGAATVDGLTTTAARECAEAEDQDLLWSYAAYCEDYGSDSEVEWTERNRADLDRAVAAYEREYQKEFEDQTWKHNYSPEDREEIARVCRGAMDAECRFQTGLLRDIFGNPFRPVSLDSAWLTPTVLALARGIYDDRAFDRLPILADALQDAGCDNPNVLGHCRGPGPHVRGCWVVDLVLGKT